MSTDKSKQKLSERYSSDSKKKSSNSSLIPKSVAIVSVVTVLAIGGIVAAAVITDNSDGKSTANTAYNLVVAPEGVEELIADRSETVAAGSYDVSMNSTWIFETGDSSSENAYVENIITNTNTVHFSVTLNETGKVIYESPYIPVGSSLRNIKLDDTSLKAGTHPCVVTYHLVNDNYEDISEVSINVNVIINK
ncbi:MAG: hypothetical protein E7270_03945 [Lachnospiraceae bacterium]|nr:hypothetical protein [Lachnospiraceae bacterium]